MPVIIIIVCFLENDKIIGNGQYKKFKDGASLTQCLSHRNKVQSSKLKLQLKSQINFLFYYNL
jgi:hypothetical protein